MKTIEIKETALVKLKKQHHELKEDDLEKSSKSFIPGEWIKLTNKKSDDEYLAYINLFTESPFKIKVLAKIEKDEIFKTENDYFKNKIEKAFLKRKANNLLVGGYRLVYGASDDLIGLIVDVFVDNVFIQINTAGIDRFRESIKTLCQEIYPEKKILFLDNEAYRKSEQLPVRESDEILEVVKVRENDFLYHVSKDSFQKIGFYYDHRMNRLKLESHLKNYKEGFDLGLDLFSYVGSWGLHMLRGKVKKVIFVDQGTMERSIYENLELNNFSGNGEFIRQDVFKYLDQALVENKKFNVIVSDPPAFAKTEKNKNNAIIGYDRLHLKCMKLLSRNALFVAASCTHYVSLLELDKSVQMAAQKENRRINLLDVGIQSPDHPIRSLDDKANYIKFLLYKVD